MQNHFIKGWFSLLAQSMFDKVLEVFNFNYYRAKVKIVKTRNSSFLADYVDIMCIPFFALSVSFSIPSTFQFCANIYCREILVTPHEL